EIVVGAGNIYACEALFEAGIDPRTRSDRISRPRADRLAAALRFTLARALDLGGSTLRDFRDAHGVAGAFQLQAGVYGRAGETCARCSGTIRRIVQGGRATFFCPGCQRR
ncbi:MAG: zinc finger domain-containing protein, partial [Caldimonas sp.]